MKYNLTDLRLFIAIAECQNLTRGAEQVFLAPSSASHRIKVLEDSLGTVLLQRKARGVELTRAGEIFLRHARQVFAGLEQMHADLAPHALGVQGHVRLWANTHATHSYLPDDLALFLGQHPQVSVTLEEHSSLDILAGVAKGDADLGIVAEVDERSDMVMLPYREDLLVIIAPRTHPLAQARQIAFQEVVNQPFVMLHAGSAIHTFTMNLAASLGQHLNVRVQVRSFEAVYRMVAAGVGIGLVPREAIRQRQDDVVFLALNEPWAKRDLKVCYHPRIPPSGFTQLLIEHLTKAQ
ncbi:LysR family transcriptional regulator [Oceanospirillum sediminis]|uniref:LysR family transcriptional regulator n=1 Tax=Oceanospirillum sediminis TaxID=2760088 RepID=A0A839INC6_9GAMM|nr:LysR family transcriptional regulator [Oceanospirillum sediminis]MBB1486401.1 LysR family transcriptional regulator [Oceanospirillum sediminis]